MFEVLVKILIFEKFRLSKKVFLLGKNFTIQSDLNIETFITNLIPSLIT